MKLMFMMKLREYYARKTLAPIQFKMYFIFLSTVELPMGKIRAYSELVL